MHRGEYNATPDRTNSGPDRRAVRPHAEAVTPMLFLSDFNTHGPLWSAPDCTPSPWAAAFCDWMDNNGLLCLNMPGDPMWFGSREEDHPSILDLTLMNEAVVFGSQLSDLTISHSESLGSDHTALLLDFFPLEGTTMPPPTAPAGYRADDNRRNAWIKAFMAAYRVADATTTAKEATTSASAGGGPATAHYLTPGAETNAYGILNPVASNPLVAAPA